MQAEEIHSHKENLVVVGRISQVRETSTPSSDSSHLIVLSEEVTLNLKKDGFTFHFKIYETDKYINIQGCFFLLFPVSDKIVNPIKAPNVSICTFLGGNCSGTFFFLCCFALRNIWVRTVKKKLPCTKSIKKFRKVSKYRYQCVSQ